MNERIEQRLAQIAEAQGYSWPAGEMAHAMRLAAEAAIVAAIEYVESKAKHVTHEDHKVGIYVAATVMHQLLPPPKEPHNDRN